MADVSINMAEALQQWDNKFYLEYLAANRFAPYMGMNENKIIQLNEDLTKKKGEYITFNLVNRLTGNGVTGNSTLEGNEEAMDLRTFRLQADQIRNAVRHSAWDDQRSPIDLRNASKTVLKNWIMEQTRDDIIAALGSINGVAYGTASEAQKDAWLVDNADRVLFGKAKGNNSSNDHSASLANIDNTDDKLTPDALSLMKRLALEGSPKIRPVIEEQMQGREYYVVFAGTRTFRDLKNNSTIQQAQREVTIKNQNNKLFKGGDIEWDGMIVHEIPDIPILSGVGASSIDASPVYLCGAQAVGFGVAKRTFTKEEKFDYEDKRGCAVGEWRGIEKMIYGSGSNDRDDTKDHGLVTGYFAAVADA